eukprot:scaffold3.g6382.t1
MGAPQAEAGTEQDGAQEARIAIFLRLRPTPRPCSLVAADAKAGWVEFRVPKDAAQGLINNSRDSYRFPFDGVLPSEAAQADVFDAVAAPVVAAALDGYSGTVFAYGQTGSGKTFTISGGTERYADRGLVPRALAALFGQIAARGAAVAYTVHLSYLEIYNEVGYDLLDPGRDVRLLEDLPRVSVLEDEDGAMHVRNLSLHATSNEEEALNLLFLGDTNRTVAETPLNQASSRSHCVFSLHLEARRAGTETVTRSRLNFVDLAGSERVAKTGLEGSAHVREARYINLSLHFLEQVIVCLQERKPHVPYRNSLLTMLLRDSLGGNCRTVMVATVSPEAAHLEEGISTCRFAQRVAQISNRVTRNEELDLPALVRRLRAENQLLRQELQLVRGGGGGTAAPGASDSNESDAAERSMVPAGEGAGSDSNAVTEAAARNLDPRRQLSDAERGRLQQQLRAYLEDTSPDAVLGLEASMLFISNAFAMLKAMLRGGVGQQRTMLQLKEGRGGDGEASGEGAAGGQQAVEDEEAKAKREVRELQLALQQKQRELDVLVGVLHKQGLLPGGGTGAQPSSWQQQQQQQLQRQLQGQRPESTHRPPSAVVTAAPPGGSAAGAVQPPPITAGMMQDQNMAFEYFCASSPAHDAVAEAKALLRARYDDAKALGTRVAAAKQRLAGLKSRLEQRRLQHSMDALLAGAGGAAAAQAAVEDEEAEARREIEQEKASYREALGQLRQAKEEVEGLQAVLDRNRARLQRDFQAWWAPAPQQTPEQPQVPDPLVGVDPEVLAAARPLLTGNPAADADIIRFYQARAALLRSQAVW